MSENSPAVAEAPGEAATMSEAQTPVCAIDPDFKRVLDSHAAHSSYYLQNQDKEIVEFGKRAMLGAIDGIDPKDTIDGMLSSLLIGLYNVTASSICRSTTTHDLDRRNEELANISKLSRAFAAVVDAHNHYRGKVNSQQTITVVHINDGGQAIVGNVAPPGRRAEKNAGSPHAKPD